MTISQKIPREILKNKNLWIWFDAAVAVALAAKNTKEFKEQLLWQPVSFIFKANWASLEKRNKI